MDGPTLRSRRAYHGWVTSRRQGLLARLRRLLGLVGAIELDLEGNRIRLATPSDLGTLLRGRTEATADLGKRFGKLAADALREELMRTIALRERLDGLQAWCFETGDPVRAGWRELTDARFVDEHQWPVILRVLAGDVDDAYRRVALHRFVQYLDSRRAAIEHELAAPQRRQVGSWALPLPDGVDRRDPRHKDGFTDPSFTSMRRNPAFGRLPPQEPVVVERGFGRPIPVYLAHRRIQLVVTAQGWALRDARDVEVELRPGRTVIGRASDCDVVLLGAPPDVSRHHLVIECEAGSLRLVDLSSQGTFVPKRAATGPLFH
jgi:hypothetical protein